MPAWYYDVRELKNTPSFRDGIDYETETRYRREGARFIIDVGADLNLRYDTVATGCVYFHRFFMLHSFKEFNKYVTALGCLFLAGKVEETPKKCKDLLRVARLRLSDEKFAPFGDDPKEEVMATERVLLQTIKFDLQLEHPYQYLIKYAKILKGPKDKAGIENMVQMAWTFINDSLCTMICLQWEPEIVAIALMYLASRLGKCTITDWGGKKGVENEKWWDQFVEDLNVDVLEDICHQVLDLYSSNPAGAAPTDKAQSISSISSKGSAGNTPSSIGAKVSPSTPTTMAPALRIELPSKIHTVVGVHSTVVGAVPKSAPPLPMLANQPPPPQAVHQIMPSYAHVHGPVPGYAYPVPMPANQPLQRPPVYAYPPPNMAGPPPAASPYSYYAQPPPQPYSIPPPRPLHAEYSHSPRPLPPGMHPAQLYSPQRVLRPPHPSKPGGRY